ncbi:DUF1810 domain-containing protein [Pseudoduganella sp. SL102]|uniref:DUF1810 domain-containing protein n=1 Tax=Pseudoduganella sp. SL102 TaxID=2995154 RepID=UPI00248ADE7A|nr:DUF1810 domain-containing protein [Pseudoduganella sp. SL102]WBS01323.1 DUF1810 domain-containing protein [Pseudoduganella sp. SL102]
MPFDLARFITAQDRVYHDVVRELRAGRKTSHWMWFIFPQLKELGRSDTAQFYGIASIDEARAYLDHPVLGARLHECTRLVNAHAGTPADVILGHVDALKFRSSMTLFSSAAPGEACFATALAAFYDGKPDQATLGLLDA